MVIPAEREARVPECISTAFSIEHRGYGMDSGIAPSARPGMTAISSYDLENPRELPDR
jgi:hypothetical protein